MRTALYAVLVAGAVFSYTSALAGEGSTLRGLKPPVDALEADSAAADAAPGELAAKWRSADALAELAPRLTLYGGSLETRRLTLNQADLLISLHRPLELGASLDAGNIN